MQNKQALIGIVAAAVILLGAGGLFLLNKNKSAAPQPNNTTRATNTTPNKTSVMGSTISDIFSSPENRKCDFDVKGASGGETKGTVYVAGGTKAYGDFDMTNSNKTSKMYVIRNEDTFYIWGDSLPTGMKMTMSVNDMASKMSGSQYSGFDASQKTDFKCTGWTVDNSKFTPPANVKFTDLGNVTGGNKTPSGTTANPSSQCSICNSLTGAANTACKTTYHCQ